MSDFVTEETVEEPPVSIETSTTETTGSEDVENDSPQSPLDNIVPMAKLRNGWFTIKNFVMKSSSAVIEKVVEVNNSDEVQAFKQKTSETASMAWETTKGTAQQAAETIQPAVEKVRNGRPCYQYTKSSLKISTIQIILTSAWLSFPTYTIRWQQ
jgi:hypothetical protein